MVILKPSKRLQEILLEKEPRLECFVKIKPDIDKSRLHEKAKQMLGVAETFYSGSLPEFYNLISELMKNSRAHTIPRNNSEIDFGLFLSRSAMCAAISDCGDFYRRKDIKYLLENKLELPQAEYSNKITDFSGSKFGLEIIYEFSDFIEVDTVNGAIYCLKRIS